MDFIWLFFIYAFMGWCAEVIYAAVCTGIFVNRGFLNGPVCPVYGFGVLIVIYLLTPLKENLILLFIGSVILTSTLEWLTGCTLENIFHHKWWDYSDVPFNISGYICLKFSLMWGLACLLIMNVIHPVIYDLIGLIDIRVGKVLISVLLACIIVDITATVQSILKLNKQLKQINEIAANIRNLSDEIGVRISTESISIMEKGEKLKNIMEKRKAVASDVIEESKSIANELIEEQRTLIAQKLERYKIRIFELKEKRNELLNKSFFGQKRLLHAFPGMKSQHYKEALEDLKQKLLNNK
ncbi:MAG: hypothetical protein PHE29_13990 [Tissierellia bacterium]|nr:hypothetical protein [Tissierellia bacterium]